MCLSFCFGEIERANNFDYLQKQSKSAPHQEEREMCSKATSGDELHS